jgi:hypothetical protein
MPIEYLDEEHVESSSSAFEYIDDEPISSSSSFEYIEDEDVPPPLDDMTYVPGDTDAEFEAWQEWSEGREDQDFTMDDAWNIVGSMAGELKAGGKAALGNLVEGRGRRIINSLGEGVLRGTADLGIMTQKVKHKLTRDEEYTRERFRAWREIRKLEAMREKARLGEEDLIDHLQFTQNMGTDDVDVDPAMAEGASYFMDIGAVGAPLAKGAGKLAGVGARRGLRAAGTATGRGIEAVGGAIDKAKSGFVERFPKTAENIGRAKNLATAAGAFVDPARTAAGRIAVEAADRLAPFGAALTKSIKDLPEFPTNFGLMERISKNKALPTKVRGAANALRAVDPALRLGASAAQGAAGGAVIGGAMGAAAADTTAEAFSGALGGAVAGAGGSVVGRGVDALTGASDAQRMANSIELFRREHKGSNETFDKLPQDARENIVGASELLRGKVDVKILPGDEFAKGQKVLGSSAYYDPGTRSIIVNGDGNAPGLDILHEVGESMWDSGLVDKGYIREKMTELYGNLDSMKRGYARSLLEGEQKGASITPEDIGKKVREIETRIYAGEPDWVIRELFSEQFMAETAGQGLHNYVRKSKLGQGLKSAMAPLGKDVKLGLDPLSKAWQQAKYGVFNALNLLSGGEGLNSLGYGDNNVFRSKLKKDSKLSKSYKKYTKQLDRQYDAARRGEEAPSQVSLDPVRNQSFDFDGPIKSFTQTAKDGTVQVIPKKQFSQQLKDNRKKTKDAVADQDVVTEDNQNIGTRYRYNNDGTVNPNRTETRGKYMQDELRDMPGFENFRGTVDAINKAIKDGEVLSSKYFGIGTRSKGDSWINSMYRNRGSIPAVERRYLPYEWFIDSQGNRLVRMINLDQVAARAKQWQDSGKIRAWNNDVDQFFADARKYIDNHKNGLPGKTGLSDEKHNIVNAFLQGNNKGINPFYSSWDSGSERIYSSLRLERIGSLDNASPQGTPLGFGPFDHLKVKRMMSPQRMPQDNFRVGTAKLGTKAKPVSTPNSSNISGDMVGDIALADHMEKMSYDHVPERIRSITDPKEKREAYIDWMVDNLLAIHDAFPGDLREMATLWYDGAFSIANDFANHYNYTAPQTAGVMAVLSPQKNWFMNVAQAEQVLDIWRNHQDTRLDDGLVWEQAEQIIDAAQAPKKKKKTAKKGETATQKKRRLKYNKDLDQKAKNDRREDFEKIIGKTIAELDGTSDLQGWAIRILAQTLYGRDYRVIAPDGTPKQIDVTKDGDNAKNGWGSVSEIEKAVSILKDGSMENISNQLGEMHKVRSFFNNIIDPNSLLGDVTIDTHAVAAGHLQPYGANATPVSHNFGTGVTKKGSPGVNGTYHVYADAYRKAAELRGLLPRQMQSITWEGIRQIFPSETRRDKKVIADAREKWNLNDDERSRQELIGGRISPPSWAGSRDGGESATIPGSIQEARQAAQSGGNLLYGRGGHVDTGRRVPRTDSGGRKSKGRGKRQKESRPSLPWSRFSVNNPRAGSQFHSAIALTEKDHKLGAAVQVKDLDFYNKSDTALFLSDDKLAGVAVTKDGDLVSVFKHPTSKADIRPILKEAARVSTTLDAFDVNGFLPNLYSEFGFKPIARVAWDDTYAPPNWPYDMAGRPDVVLMVKDPRGIIEAPSGDFNQVKNSVPLFTEYEDALKLQQEAKAKVVAAGLPESTRFSPSRTLNNRGGAIYMSPSGFRAIQVDSRSGVRMWDPSGKRVGPVFTSIEKAERFLENN